MERLRLLCMMTSKAAIRVGRGTFAGSLAPVKTYSFFSYHGFRQPKALKTVQRKRVLVFSSKELPGTWVWRLGDREKDVGGPCPQQMGRGGGLQGFGRSSWTSGPVRRGTEALCYAALG